MSEDNMGESETVLTRRQAMSTGGAVAGAALLSKYSVRTASAQSTEPRIQLGPDWEIDDIDDGSGNTDLSLTHTPDGAEFRRDVSAGEWSLDTLSATTGSFTTSNVSELSVIGATLDTTQTISNGSVTTLNIDSFTSEDSSVLSVDTSNNKVVVKEAGTYLMFANVLWNSSTGWSTGNRADVRPTHNGTALTGRGVEKIGEGPSMRKGVALVDAAVNDELTFTVYQNSGASKDIGKSTTRYDFARFG